MIHIAHGERLNEGVIGLLIRITTFKGPISEPKFFTRVRIKQIKEYGQYRAILNFNIEYRLMSEKEIINKLVEKFDCKVEGTFSNMIRIEKDWVEALEWLDSLVTMFSLSEGATFSNYELV